MARHGASRDHESGQTQDHDRSRPHHGCWPAGNQGLTERLSSSNPWPALPCCVRLQAGLFMRPWPFPTDTRHQKGRGVARRIEGTCLVWSIVDCAKAATEIITDMAVMIDLIGVFPPSASRPYFFGPGSTGRCGPQSAPGSAVAAPVYRVVAALA
jgi:hypothetical protein